MERTYVGCYEAQISLETIIRLEPPHVGCYFVNFGPTALSTPKVLAGRILKREREQACANSSNYARAQTGRC
jgi:hypothetical protein